MKIVVLIHAHKDPAQINHLIGAFADERFRVYVNLDLKSAIAPGELDARAVLVKNRIDIHWGGFSLVQATLNSLEEIERAEDYGRVIFISGQDYPVWSNDRIHDLLAGAGRSEFLHFAPMSEAGWREGAHRVDFYYYGGASRAVALAYGAARKAMRVLGLKRRPPAGLTPYGGSGWFTITRRAVRLILARVGADPAYVAYMQSVSIPDELFFQTLLLNSELKADVVNDNHRYIDWSQRLPNPKILTEDDYGKIRSSGKMLCRKLDWTRSAKLVEMLDAGR